MSLPATNSDTSLLIPLSCSYTHVDDADEEIFLLYTNLQRTPTHDLHSNGLGYVDSRQDVLNVSFDIDVPALSKKKGKMSTTQKRTISIELAQDKTALRTRKGDTGSILWRVSVEFARLVLQQHAYSTQPTLFNHSKLKCAHVLELGSGTGLLAILLAPLVASYTATDLEDLVPLIRKNVAANAPISGNIASVAPLDWVMLHDTPFGSMSRLFPQPYDKLEVKPDLIIAADCIYHPSLIKPLIHTMNALSSPETLVLILGQLREVEVLRQFVSEWLGSGWDIWRVETDEKCVLGPGFVVWVGKRIKSRG